MIIFITTILYFSLFNIYTHLLRMLFRLIGIMEQMFRKPKIVFPSEGKIFLQLEKKYFPSNRKIK